MHVRMARYGYTGDARDIAQTAERGMLPIFQSQPGFVSYSLAEGDDEILSMSVWSSHADAERGTEAAADWIAKNLSSQLDLIELRYGDLLFSTSLGVTTATAASTA